MTSIQSSTKASKRRKVSPSDSTETSSEKRRSMSGVFLQPPTLFQASCNAVGRSQPYELVELYHNTVAPVPEEVQLAIMKAAFPLDKNAIRQYAYLSRKQSDSCCDLELAEASATSGAETIGDGNLIEKKVVQIGFVLTGSFSTSPGLPFVSVSVSFDRCRITWMTCSEHQSERWCQHAVRLIFFRIDQPGKVEYRLPVSTSIQQLDQRQGKQFLNMLLSEFQLEILPRAQEILDKLLKCPLSSSDCNNVSDPTAGASVDDDPFWCVGDSELRRLVRLYCEQAEGAGRYVSLGKVNSQAAWTSLVKEKPQGVKGRGISKEKMFESRGKDLDMVIQLIMSMLKKGDHSAVEALRSITDEWLCSLAMKSDGYVRLQSAGGTGVAVAVDVEQKLSNSMDLLSVTASPWFLPDQIINCWRLAVLCPKLSLTDSFYNDLLSEHEKYASVLNTFLHDVTTQLAVPTAHKQLWESLVGWTGFEHIKVLVSEEAQEIIARASRLRTGDLQQFTDAVTCEGITQCHECGDKCGSFMWTAGCFIECLLFYGYEEAAAELAVGCVEFLFVGQSERRKGAVNGACGLLEPGGLVHSIVRLHEENAEMLWGGGCDGSLLVPIIVVFRALERRSGLPWANTSPRMDCSVSGVVPGVSLGGDEFDVVCSYVAAVGVTCCILPLEGLPVTSQIDIATEKNRILTSTMKLCGEEARTAILQNLTKLLLEVSKSREDQATVDMTGTLQLMLIASVMLLNESDPQVLSILTTVAEELVVFVRQHVALEATQMVSCGQDRESSFYTQTVRLGALVLSSLKRTVCVSEMIDGILYRVVNVAVGSLPFGRQRFIDLSLDLLEIVRFCFGLEVSRDDCMLHERFKLLLCGDAEELVTQGSDKLAGSVEERRQSSLDGLLLLLRADKIVGGRNRELRPKALGLLEEMQELVPGISILRSLQSLTWNDVLTGTEFVFRLLAKKSFQSSFLSSKEVADKEGLVEVVTQAAVQVKGRDCDVLYVCARELNQLDVLFQLSLTSGSDLNKTACEVLLFRLCRDTKQDKEKRLELGLLALRHWKDRHRQPVALNGNVFDHLLCDDEPDLHAVLGLFWLCALAVFMDLMPTRTLSKARPVKMAAIEKLLTAVAENWIDPLLSFHVLIEVARLWGHFYEVQSLVLNPPAGVRKRGERVEPPTLLGTHESLINESSALPSVQSLCQRLPTAMQLAEKCKCGLVGAIRLADCSGQSQLSSGGSSSATQCEFIPNRPLVIGDFMALDFIRKTIPSPDVNMVALVSRSDSCPVLLCRFRELCEEFVSLTNLLEKYPNVPPDEHRANVKFVQVMAMGGKLLAEGAFPYFGPSNDDGDGN